MGSDCDYCGRMIRDGERTSFTVDVKTGSPDGRLWAHWLCHTSRKGEGKESGGASEEDVVGEPGEESNNPPSPPRAGKGIVVLAGPSGVGKSTIVRSLLRRRPDRFGYSASHTTRAPRDEETDGVHYHFVSPAGFEGLVREGSFVEHTVYSGNRYGTSKESLSAVVASGRVCLLDLDMEGVRSLKDARTPCTYVFVAPPSLEELRRRMSTRGDGKVVIEQRMGLAKQEVGQGMTPGLFHHVLVNDDLERVVSRLEELLLA